LGLKAGGRPRGLTPRSTSLVAPPQKTAENHETDQRDRQPDPRPLRRFRQRLRAEVRVGRHERPSGFEPLQARFGLVDIAL